MWRFVHEKILFAKRTARVSAHPPHTVQVAARRPMSDARSQRTLGERVIRRSLAENTRLDCGHSYGNQLMETHKRRKLLSAERRHDSLQHRLTPEDALSSPAPVLLTAWQSTVGVCDKRLTRKCCLAFTRFLNKWQQHFGHFSSTTVYF